MRYRKKPVVIDAVQLCKGMRIPWWLYEAMNTSQVLAGGLNNITRDQPWASINTLEGTMRAEAGDWIIRGVQGEIYPCKPDIFAATYELAEDAQ